MLTDPQIDIRGFWQAISNRAVGAAVVATGGPGGRAGFFALSATHLTASPPTVMVSIDASTSALAAVRRSGAFSVNYLPSSREDLVSVFSGKSERQADDRFDDEDWITLKTGAPILRDAVGALDCELEEALERHGAVIAIGRLVAYRSEPAAIPLVSFRGGYLRVGRSA